MWRKEAFNVWKSLGGQTRAAFPNMTKNEIKKRVNFTNIQIQIFIKFTLCPERESNPYGHHWPRDFKSLVSTNSTIWALASAKVQMLIQNSKFINSKIHGKSKKRIPQSIIPSPDSRQREGNDELSSTPLHVSRKETTNCRQLHFTSAGSK